MCVEYFFCILYFFFSRTTKIANLNCNQKVFVFLNSLWHWYFFYLSFCKSLYFEKKLFYLKDEKFCRISNFTAQNWLQTSTKRGKFFLKIKCYAIFIKPKMVINLIIYIADSTILTIKLKLFDSIVFKEIYKDEIMAKLHTKKIQMLTVVI